MLEGTEKALIEHAHHCSSAYPSATECCSHPDSSTIKSCNRYQDHRQFVDGYAGVGCRRSTECDDRGTATFHVAR